MTNELENYNKESDGYHLIELALKQGYVDIGRNVWAKKEDILKNCDCLMLTKNGFKPRIKQN